MRRGYGLANSGPRRSGKWGQKTECGFFVDFLNTFNSFAAFSIPSELRHHLLKPYITLHFFSIPDPDKKTPLSAIPDFLLAQAACVRHACLRAPCVAWPLFSRTFALSLLFFSFFSPSSAFAPLRGISRVRKFASPNILA